MKSQKFQPFRQLPQQIQNSGFVRKLQNLTSPRGLHKFGSYLSSVYGCVDEPSAVAVDSTLGLFAVGNANGCVRIYGAAGVVFGLIANGPAVQALKFIPSEGRILVACRNGCIYLYELNVTEGQWILRSQARLPFISDEAITTVAYCNEILYIGSTHGVVRQLVVKENQLTVGDDVLSACTDGFVLDRIPIESRGDLNLSAQIVSLEVEPGSAPHRLLIAYESGCVAVAEPRPIPQPVPVSEEPSEEVKPVEATDPPATTTTENGDASADAADPVTAEPKEAIADDTIDEQEPAKQPPSTPAKSALEKRGTLNFKALARSLKFDHKSEHTRSSANATHEANSTLQAPPVPRISHIVLRRDQVIHCATWRRNSELAVAFADGSFQVWPVGASDDATGGDAVVISMRDPPSTPYGPLPCSAITKMLIQPGVDGGMLTAFAGGLPRPQFDQRHAVTVMQDHDHHVCFEFASPVVDFLFTFKRDQPADRSGDESKEEEEKEVADVPACANALLVMTENELVAIDLVSRDWPTFTSPYLSWVDVQAHCTSIVHSAQVPSSLVDQLISTSSSSARHAPSSLSWPIWAGACDSSESPSDSVVDLVVLGRDDGLLELLSLGCGDAFTRIGTLDTRSLFESEDAESNANGHSEETWPPFRRVGRFPHSPASSDQHSRLSITNINIYYSLETELTVIVGSAGGQVSVWSSLNKSTVSRVEANLIPEDEREKFVWNGPPVMKPSNGTQASHLLSPTCVVQLNPPAPVSSLTFEPEWNLLVVGSCHGFAVVDLQSSEPAIVYSEFLYPRVALASGHAQAARPKHNASVSAMQAAIVSRGKQLSASMRQSFRRLKEFSTSMTSSSPSRQKTVVEGNEEGAEHKEGVETTDKQVDGETPEQQPTTSDQPDETAAEVAPDAAKPDPEPATPTADIEKPLADAPLAAEEVEVSQVAVEPEPQPPVELSSDDKFNSVTSTHFTDACLPTKSAAAACLWVGTSSGLVLCFTVVRAEDRVTLELAHQIQLGHRGCILAFAVLDVDNHYAPVGCTKESCLPKPEVTPEPAADESVESKPVDTPEADAPQTTEPEVAEVPANASVDNDQQPQEESQPQAPEPTLTEVPPRHCLLICSVDQVKLVSLSNNWRTTSKRRLVSSLSAATTDRFASVKKRFASPAPHPAESGNKTNDKSDLTESEPKVEDEAAKVEGAEGKGDVEELKAIGESPQKSPGAASTVETTQVEAKPELPPATSHKTEKPHHSSVHRKSVTGFAMQSFTRVGNDPATPNKTEWNLVLSVQCGQTLILDLPSLWRMFKIKNPPTTLPPGLAPCLSNAASSSNLALWPSTRSQILACELAPLPRLTSPATSHQQINSGHPLTRIWLPVGARPIIVEPVVEEPTDQVVETAVQANGVEAVPDLTNGHSNGDTHDEELHASVNVPSAPDAEKPPKSVKPADDDDIDMLKHCLNGDGKLTVSTLETSTEKRTLVEGGQVVTTIHETEKVDGKFTKNDVVQFASGGGAEQTVTESST